MTTLHIIQDSKGKDTGVFIPIKDWKKLKQKYEDLDKLEKVNLEKKEIIQDIKDAIHELNLIKAGKLNARNAEDFLNEL